MRIIIFVNSVPRKRAEPNTGLEAVASDGPGQVSPTLRWLAYQGQLGTTGPPDMLVRPFGGGTALYQVSSGGGARPRWRADGRELFYVEPTTPRELGKLMAVEIGSSETAFDHGSPRPLFESRLTSFQHPPGISYHLFAVSRDGQRFLVPRPVTSSAPDS